MEKLIEAIKSKDLVKAKKIFNGLMEDVKGNLVEEERKKISSGVVTEDEEGDDGEDDDSTENKVDSADPSDEEADNKEDA